jgi:glycolate oxidase
MNTVAPPPDLIEIQALQAKLVSALRPILAEDGLLWEPEDTIPYECDGLAAYRRMPLAVALPENEAQVSRILQICHAMNIPVVPRGAGTGLSGGAMPIAQGLVLSLAKLKKILDINPFTRTAVVQPGVRNLAISEAVAHLGLYYAPDPSSQIACSIGGNVNENSGGVHCLKYGLTLHNVLRVRGVLMSGDIVEFGSLAPDAPGLDLLAIVMGSEGMLAAVTEVTVKLVPKPKLAQVIMASFDDIEKGGNAVAAIIAAGIIPAGLEMMDKATTRAVEEFVHAGYDLDAVAILLCESDGTPEEVAEEIGRMTAVLEKAGASGIRISKNETERLTFWSGRKNAFPAAGRIAADYYCMDGTIPRRHIATLLRRIQEMEKKISTGLLECISCGRRQYASAHFV